MMEWLYLYGHITLCHGIIDVGDQMKSKINVVFNLAFLLERDNISQAQLMRDVKAVSKAQVYRWIHKGEMPHVGYVLRMHDKYGWTLREMFREEESE
jgi:hypothetical protein